MSFLNVFKLRFRELDEPVFDEKLSGVRFFDVHAVSPGYNLFDGTLTDLDGRVRKTWKADYLSLILPDGRYLAQIYYGLSAWGMYSWKDETIWENKMPIHHDLISTPQNTILTLTKEMREYCGRKIDFCAIVEFDMKGQEIFRWSTWDHLKEVQKFHPPCALDRPKAFFKSEPAGYKETTPWGGNYDYYRLNSICVLPASELGDRDARFREGNWFISLRHANLLLILDQDTKNIVWKCAGKDVKGGLQGQHSAQFLPTGQILLFDNGRERGWSRVIEIDPVTHEILWEYRAKHFFSLSLGWVQRLPNGNTLITESERGRAFEVTPAQKIVWEYYHPSQQDVFNCMHPKSFGKRLWIHRMVRYDRNFIDGFLA